MIMSAPDQQRLSEPRRLLPGGASPTGSRGDAMTDVDVGQPRDSGRRHDDFSSMPQVGHGASHSIGQALQACGAAGPPSRLDGSCVRLA